MKREIIKKDLDHILFHTDSIWNELYKKKIFITGGTGFFGKWLLESFVHANDYHQLHCELHILSRNPSIFIKKNPEIADNKSLFFHVGDIRDFKFPDMTFEFIIHGANDVVNLSHPDPVSIIDVSVNGTKRILGFANKCNARRILYLSSGAVYGPQPPDLKKVKEDHLGKLNYMDSASSYAESKRIGELLCFFCANKDNFDCIVARGFAFVGPYLELEAHFAIGNFIKNAIDKKPIKVNGDGTPFRSYLYAADLAIWLWSILLKGKPGNAYNVGSDIELTIKELAEKISKYFNGRSTVEILKNPQPGQISSRYIPNIEKAKKELGLDVWIGLDESIRRTVNFLL